MLVSRQIILTNCKRVNVTKVLKYVSNLLIMLKRCKCAEICYQFVKTCLERMNTLATCLNVLEMCLN